MSTKLNNCCDMFKQITCTIGDSIYAATTWLDTFHHHLSTKIENHMFNSSHHQKLVTASLLFAPFCYSIDEPTKERTLSKIRITVILKYAFIAVTLVWKHSLPLCSFKTLTYSIKCASKRCSSNGKTPPSTVGYGQLEGPALTNPAISWNTTKAKDNYISHLENRRNSIKIEVPFMKHLRQICSAKVRYFPGHLYRQGTTHQTAPQEYGYNLSLSKSN